MHVRPSHSKALQLLQVNAAGNLLPAVTCICHSAQAVQSSRASTLLVIGRPMPSDCSAWLLLLGCCRQGASLQAHQLVGIQVRVLFAKDASGLS
jgi:hypothetical protein